MLNKIQLGAIDAAKIAAEEVLLNNSRGPFQDLPRTAGWGYPEPYTRDLLFSIFGIAVTHNEKLYASIKHVLEVLSINQTAHGHIPSIVHDPHNRGASDTTPLFLLAVGIYRKMTGNWTFLEKAVNRSLCWMTYQSPIDNGIIAQQPTSDWRDEQWVLGYGIYVNAIYHCALLMLGDKDRANSLAKGINMLSTKQDPYYKIWIYKIYHSDRFDLLGNSLAILSGLASPQKGKSIIDWVERSCQSMRKQRVLAVDIPPNFFPFIYPDDRDWHERYSEFNKPGDYHNGGIWPFICALYIAALVKVGLFDLAEAKLVTLTALVENAVDSGLKYGFNEWLKSQNGKPQGQDWQTWSAALYLYATKCVEKRSVPFFNIT